MVKQKQWNAMILIRQDCKNSQMSIKEIDQKKKKRRYARNRYKNMPDEKKQKDKISEKLL